MSIQELNDILANMQISVYFDHYEPTPEMPNIVPPFILYRDVDADTKKAGNRVVDIENNYIVDLITETKNITLEQKLETLFDTNCIIYDKECDYIASDKVYQIRYFI